MSYLKNSGRAVYGYPHKESTEAQEGNEVNIDLGVSEGKEISSDTPKKKISKTLLAAALLVSFQKVYNQDGNNS